jgi:glycosyltransferase involved in cell wall biosynthesis
VIGDLEQIPSYKSKIIQLSKNLNVEFIPLIRQKELLLKYVSQADLFVFASYSENMSIMLLEVAYTKTPLICSDIEPNKAIFNSSEVLFFNTNDVEDLKVKIDFANKNSNIMKEKAINAFNKVQSNYNWKSISNQYEKLFLSSLKLE